MKKILLPILLFLSTSVCAEKGHIADDLETFIHNGPSNQYRILSRVKSGTSVEILKHDTKTKYTQIRMPDGSVGWIESRAVALGDSLLISLPILQESLKKSQATVKKQRIEQQRLKEKSKTLETQNRHLSQDVDQLQAQIKELNFQIESNDSANSLRWLTHGGIIALAGVILGLVISFLPGRKKRKQEWF